jgi:large conductance mechanosensitive channel
MAKNKNKKPGILKEFKTFITRGNVIDMATGVIVAGAFTKIITALTNNVFLPVVNYLVSLATNGKQVLLISILNKQPYFLESVNDAGEIVKTVNPECIFIDWGIVLEAVVNFILIAAIIFTIVKVINHTRAKIDAIKAKAREDERFLEKANDAELAEIRQYELASTSLELSVEDKFWDVGREIGEAYLNSEYLKEKTWEEFLKEKMDELRNPLK